VLRLVADPYPPYQHADGGLVRGLDHDLVTAVFAAAGYEARTELLPWSECLAAVREGDADAIYQITPTAERSEWMAFSRSFREAQTVLYRRRGELPEGLGEGGLAALAARCRLGALAGFSYGPQASAAPVAARFESDDELLHGLREGEVDVVLVDAGVATHLLSDDRLEPIPGFSAGRPLHLGCRADLVEIAREFDRGLAKMGAAAGA
jgi:polar amino acid transport system substrate-binding protein